MEAKEHPRLASSRNRTDKSLEDERIRTDIIIGLESAIVESQSDSKTLLNRVTADEALKKNRAAVDGIETGFGNTAPDDALLNEREHSDKAKIVARQEEDRLRAKEREQKQRLAEVLLESERRDTDENLLEERERTDLAQDKTKEELITRDKFLAVLSHDLKNPLNAISMGASVLRIELSRGLRSKEDLLEVLAMIERSAANMDTMITELLDVEKMANGKLLLEKKEADVGGLLEECAAFFRPIALTKSIALAIEKADEPLVAWLDPGKTLQVLSNLVGNALKFSPQGSTVKLSAVRAAEHVEFSVTDTGPGIPEEKRDAIFERFHQGNAEDNSGLGLGLFIAKWIVEAHEGSIYVMSEFGKGSTFKFILPQGTRPLGA